MGKVKKKLNLKLEIGGIIFTNVDRRLRFSRDIIRNIKEGYGNNIRVYESIIPRSARASEISAEGKSIYLHDPKVKVDEAYGKFVEEVLEWEGVQAK